MIKFIKSLFKKKSNPKLIFSFYVHRYGIYSVLDFNHMKDGKPKVILDKNDSGKPDEEIVKYIIELLNESKDEIGDINNAVI